MHRRSAASPVRPPLHPLWNHCCAKGDRNSLSGAEAQRFGRRTGRRGRRSPRAASASSSSPSSSRRATSRRRSRELVDGVKRHERTQVLLGVTGSGKTFTMAKVIEATQRPALVLAPEQDAGRAALRRVQELLSRQRGRVFRLLLRLLPAGSLRPAHRHLYREGILDQRADRPHAPLGDARAAGTRRRDHRRLGVVHLRHRLGRDLFGDDVHAEAWRAHRPAPADRRSGRAAIQAHAAATFPAAPSGCAAT